MKILDEILNFPSWNRGKSMRATSSLDQVFRIWSDRTMSRATMENNSHSSGRIDQAIVHTDLVEIPCTSQQVVLLNYLKCFLYAACNQGEIGNSPCRSTARTIASSWICRAQYGSGIDPALTARCLSSNNSTSTCPVVSTTPRLRLSHWRSRLCGRLQLGGSCGIRTCSGKDPPSG